MNRNIGTICVVSLVILIIALPTSSIRAHGTPEAHAKEQMASLTIPEMEQMIVLLTKLISLLIEQQKLSSKVQPHISLGTPASEKIVPPLSATSTSGISTSSSSVAHITPGMTPTSTKLFAIEVEEHDGNTHVHVRYIDKPEEMFFVNAPISNENALIIDIKTRTNLPLSVIKPALVYYR
jgi:hypothetical protein